MRPTSSRPGSRRKAASKTGPSGVGVENYDWYLQHVMLLPYTWRDLVTLMERELARAHSSLALEEASNAALPPQTPIASAEEHARRSTRPCPSTSRSFAIARS